VGKQDEREKAAAEISRMRVFLSPCFATRDCRSLFLSDFLFRGSFSVHQQKKKRKKKEKLGRRESKVIV